MLKCNLLRNRDEEYHKSGNMRKETLNELNISAAAHLNVLRSQLRRSFLRHLDRFLRFLLLRDLQVGLLGHELDVSRRRVIG